MNPETSASETRPLWPAARDVFMISIERMLPRPRSFDMEGDDVFKSCTRRIRDRIFGRTRTARQPSEAIS